MMKFLSQVSPFDKGKPVRLGQDKVLAGAKIVLGDLVLVPILRVSCSCSSLGGGVVFTGSKVPVAMLMISSQGRSAVNMDGEEVSIEQFLAFPEIRDQVESL